MPQEVNLRLICDRLPFIGIVMSVMGPANRNFWARFLLIINKHSWMMENKGYVLSRFVMALNRTS
jgi:rRNA processing protein Gar1